MEPPTVSGSLTRRGFRAISKMMRPKPPPPPKPKKYRAPAPPPKETPEVVSYDETSPLTRQEKTEASGNEASRTSVRTEAEHLPAAAETDRLLPATKAADEMTTSTSQAVVNSGDGSRRSKGLPRSSERPPPHPGSSVKKYPAPLPPNRCGSNRVDDIQRTHAVSSSASKSVHFTEERLRLACSFTAPKTSPAIDSHGSEDLGNSVNAMSAPANSDADGSGTDDVIYDQPSLERLRGPVDRTFVLCDGYLKPRSSETSVGGDSSKSHPTKVTSRPIGGVALPAVTTKRAASDVTKLKVGDVTKPTVSDVRCVRQWTKRSTTRPLRTCRSNESIDRLGLLLGGGGEDLRSPTTTRTARSSFVDPLGPPTRRSVYIELGEYQTLLKHSKNEADHVYSLPQPQCYGEDTIRAVRLITEKYDTFKRRQIRAQSFRGPGTSAATAAVGKNGLSSPASMSPSSEPRTSEVEDDRRKLLRRRDHPVSSDICEVDVEEDADDQKTAETERDVAIDGSDDRLRLKRLDLSRGTPEVDADVTKYATTTPDVDDASFDLDGGIARTDRARIELFYRSLDAVIYVCSSLADLFVGAVATTSANDDGSGGCHWVHTHTGVPVWVMNSGAGTRRRELTVVLAERETGYPLWSDKINYLSNFRQLDDGGGVQVLRVSGSLSRMVRLDVFRRRSADEFHSRFLQLTADSNDDLWKISEMENAGARRRRRRKDNAGKKQNRMSKSTISQPCNVVHVTRIDVRDANFRAAFSDLLPPLGHHVQVPLAAASGKGSVYQAATRITADRSTTDGGEQDTDTDLLLDFRPRLPTS